MRLKFKHDGTGTSRPWATTVLVTITAAAHTYHRGQRMKGLNWLTWEPHRPASGPVHSDTFAEAVFQAAEFAAILTGGCVLTEIEGVPVPEGWDAVALLTESWQADPPFSDWPEIITA